MKAKASIITKYDEADSSGKVDLICRYYPNFLGIVDGYTEGLCYVIENEKSYNRKASRGDLGVSLDGLIITIILQKVRMSMLLKIKYSLE